MTDEKLMSDAKLQILEAQSRPSRINTKQKKTNKQTPNQKPSTWHVIFKLQKIKGKVLEDTKGIKYLTYRETKVRITSDFANHESKKRVE